MSVLFQGNRILAVEPAARLDPPAGARIIEAAGATLLPGMWDMHVHVQTNLDGLLHLAHGVTSTRDMGNQPEAVLRWRRLFSTGELAGPRLMLAGLIDGRSPTATSGIQIATPEELSRAITMFADNGYQEIKIYSSFPRALLARAIEQAHARGLRIGGHVPVGLRMDDVVRMGFDDVSHGNFLLLNFLDDEVQTRTNTMARVLEPARRGAAIDAQGAAVTRFISALREHGTVLDATMIVVAALFGDGGANRGVLPSSEEERALYARSTQNAYRIVRRIHDAGVPLVPGTDGIAGEQYVDELMTYRAAGIPALEVLRMATLNPARMMRLDGELGSIAPGKLADMILVEGDPSDDLANLRRLRLTIRNGDLFERSRIEAELGPLATPARR